MLITSQNLADPDATYAKLLAAHDGLSQAESAALNARLILILINHIGSDDLMTQAITAAQTARGAAPE
jgi:Protein of unknown function (DUF2783)